MTRATLLTTGLALAAGFVIGSPVANPQEREQPSSVNAGATPRTPNGKPDFNGFFQWPTEMPGDYKGKSQSTVFDQKYFASLKPGGEPFFEPRTGDIHHDEPRSFCMPSGFPSGMLAGYAVQIVQTKNYIVIVNEFQRMTRLIPLDGRPHRKGLEPSYYGDSIGRFDGDALVIDTTNFKRWMLDEYYETKSTEYRMHSDALHTVERVRWKNPRALSYELTIDDPKIFERPWKQEFDMPARPQWDAQGIYEFVCEDNNKCPGGTCKVE